MNNNGFLMSWLLGNITEEVLIMVVSVDTTLKVLSTLEEQSLSNTKENEERLGYCLFKVKKGS